MVVRLNPYLSFRDTAEEAMTFYQSVFGGELVVTKFGDIPMPGIAADQAHKVMHSQIDVPGVLTLMGADAPDGMDVSTGNHPVSLSGDDDATLRAWWDALAEGGTVTMALNAAPWGDTYGQLVDRFGISWLMNIAGTGA